MMRPWGRSYITDTGSRKSWSFVRKTFLGFRDDGFAKALKTTIRERGSPRHVPAIVCRVPDVPRTNNGKKVEMACMNLLRGRPVANRGSIANAGVVDFYEALAPHLEKLLPQGGR